MIYKGRNLDVISLWEFLGASFPDVSPDNLPTYMPKIACLNPAHDTFKRHMQVNTRKPVVHCFANCGISGTYEKAVAMILDLHTDKGEWDLRAATRIILSHTRAALRGAPSAFEKRGTRKSFDAESQVAVDEKRLNAGDFTYLPADARAYLDSRGIEAPSRGKWQIGWDEDEERIVIPAFDGRGRFKFLIRRSITKGGSLKYLYTQGVMKTSILFGANMLDGNQVREQGMILVEGSLDVIRMHQLGFRNTVGILGTGISTKQVRIIYDHDTPRLYDFFDKDAAGVDNILATRERLTKLPIFVMRLPTHRDDPAEMNRQEVERAMDRSLTMGQFIKVARNAITKEKVKA